MEGVRIKGIFASVRFHGGEETCREQRRKECRDSYHPSRAGSAAGIESRVRWTLYGPTFARTIGRKKELIEFHGSENVEEATVHRRKA